MPNLFRHFFILLPLLAVFAFTCSTKQPKVVVATSVASDILPYHLAQPNHTIFFESDALREISGLTATHEPGIFCAVQDEKGVVYFLDGERGGNILREVPFREKGDFEGVEMVNEQIFAVKSDGKIFKITNWKNAEPKVEEFKTHLKKENDVEGLGYDSRRNALLLACKGNPDSAHLRPIYSFDLKENVLSERPTFIIDPQKIDDMLPPFEKSSKRYFAPSGIAMHPTRAEIYVISSIRKLLLVLDYDSGNIKYLIQLDKSLLPQPEGITFDAAGNLFLSTEGKKGEGMLLRFDMKK